MRLRQAQRDVVSAALGTCLLLVLAFGRPGTRAAAVEARGIPVRLAYFPNLTHAPALVGVARGSFQRGMPGYAFSSVVVNAGPEAMEALLAGAIDFAYVGPSPAINTFLKTHGRALRIISGACSGGASLVRRSDVHIDSIRDLDGKRVAIPQLGGTQDVSLRTFIARNGLAPRERGGTVEILPIKNPDVLSLFLQKQLDAAWVPEPWAARLKHDAHAVTVIDERDLWPGRRFTTTVLVVRRAFAEAHPDAVSDMIRVNEESVAWLQQNGPEAQRVVNSELKRLTGKALKADILSDAWGHVDFSTDPNMSSLKAFALAAKEAGYSHDPIRNLEAIVDTPVKVTAR